MSAKRTLVEIAHDEGYGEHLLLHINSAFGGKDMRAERILTIQESDSPKDGGPAFPSQAYDDGMTLRDYFAANANEDDVRRHRTLIETKSPYRTVSAEEAKYAYADAMIAQRSKQTDAPST